MTEDKKIDWNQLIHEPNSEEEAVDISEETVRAPIDWSLLSESQPASAVSESISEDPSKIIDWTELTQPSEDNK
jgi:hypothetical protein